MAGVYIFPPSKIRCPQKTWGEFDEWRRMNCKYYKKAIIEFSLIAFFVYLYKFVIILSNVLN
jgi:hypothetical protein